MIAHYLTTVLFPLADIVIDIHTGGRSVDFYPCATCTWSKIASSDGRWSRGRWPGTRDFAFLYADIAGTGLLPGRGRAAGQDRDHHRDGRRRAGLGRACTA